MASTERMRIILDAVDNASGTLKGVSSQVGKLQGIFSTAIAGVSVAAIASATIELTKLGAQAERLEASFQGLAGTKAPAMLDQLRAAAQGTIDDMSLMQSANKAMMLGVTQDAEQMAQLLQVASVRGRAMGLSTQQAFNDIVTGIGRMSPLILDNLGILTGGEAAFQAYAESIGKTSAQLTDAERKQFLVNKVTAEAGPVSLDTAAKIDTLAVAYANLKVQVGRSFLGIGEATGWFAQMLRDLGKENEVLADVRLAQRSYSAALMETGYAADVYTEKMGAVSEASADVTQRILDGEITLEEYVRILYEADPAAGVAAASALGFAGTLPILEANARAATAALYDLYLAETQAQGVYIEPLQRTRYTRPELQQQALGASGISIGMGGEVIQQGTSGIVAKEALRDQYRDYEKEQERLARSLSGGASKMASEAERAAEQYQSSLRGLAESILTPSAVSEADMLRTRLGTYEGYWDEYVRRLQSAATDSNSAWRHMIPGDVLAQGADAMKLWVEQEKQAFYAGQRLESVDWDAFTKAAEEEQSRRAAREALVAEGVRRLGGTMTQSEVAGLLGVGTTGQDSGAAYVEQFTAGAAGADVGGQLTATIDAQFRANEPEWMAMGRLTMGFFLKGAQESVNGDMVRGLWNALLPHMGDWMARQGGKP